MLTLNHGKNAEQAVESCGGQWICSVGIQEAVMSYLQPVANVNAALNAEKCPSHFLCLTQASHSSQG